MIRYLIGIIISFIALTFVRAVWGIVQKAVVDEVKSAVGEDSPAEQTRRPQPGSTSTTLRKCVGCGTYKPESAMIHYGSGEKSIYFCSADCEKKAS
ncbi:MAG TPA: hypothetical protein VFQ91_10610 [Bryobacteraceae bacterium]|nr:hypothetical protein [Bryobacteraceae bacterium]